MELKTDELDHLGNTKGQKRGGVLLFKALQEPKSMHSLAKQGGVVVEARDNVFLKHTPPVFCCFVRVSPS
jgi:hypothetical protein